jgi:hypothetical protein
MRVREIGNEGVKGLRRLTSTFLVEFEKSLEKCQDNPPTRGPI